MLPWIRSDKRNYKKVAMTLSCLFLVTFFVFSFASVASAQGDTFGINKVGSFLPLGDDDIRVIAAKIIRIFLSLLGIVAVGLMLYAGFTWMTSGGNEEKIATAKKTMINAGIGLFIIMTSFAIVQFVLKSLQSATGSGDGSGSGRAALNFDSYLGSGALGRIVKDHYPLRGQTKVPRNTYITVTFREPIDPASLINNTNGNQVVGDCINTNDPGFDWGPRFCDQVNTSSVKIGVAATTTVAIDAAATTVLEGANRDAYNFTFRPLTSLGSSEAEVEYTVELTRSINKKDGETSAFAGDRHGFYKWSFITDTIEDKKPPYVVSVYPDNGDVGARNSIVQINFSEPIFAGSVLPDPAKNFYPLAFQAANIEGQWRLSNGNKTLEFLSSQPCGQNSCGETMYCLPTRCGPEDDQCLEDYQVLIRTALTLRGDSFEAVPFTGVTDLAGNALDNGPGNEPDGILASPHRPGFAQAEPQVLHAEEKAPDNYNWAFGIANFIDRSAPIIEKVTPNLDAENVNQEAPLQIYFSKRLYGFSLDALEIEEYPRPVDLVANNAAFRNLGDIWFRPEAFLVTSTNKHIVTLDHREFGPQGTNFYYFPLIPSTVKSVTQNCFHPGRGPFAGGGAKPAGEFSPVCSVEEDVNGNVVRSAGCVPIPNNFTSEEDTGCVQYSNPGIGAVLGTTTTCMQRMKDAQISPLQPIVPPAPPVAQP